MCLLAVALASSQDVLGQKPQLAEDVFKNVLVLKGIPVDEFMDTMGMFAASLSLNCTDCHTGGSSNWERFADDTALKQTARKMILMVGAINRGNFKGKPSVTCYTCHRGDQRPKVVPSLTVQYSAPIEDPNDIEIFPDPAAPSVDQVFDKYIQALGGAQRAANLTSFIAKGTYEGYDTDHEKVPLEVFAKAPGLRATIVHFSFGDTIRTYDGRSGWIAAAGALLPLMPMTGGNLEGARMEAILSFPTRLKETYSQWRVGSTAIGDREIQVLQGTSTSQPPINLYFDKQSGLLVRLVRFTETLVGRVPTQIDYADYRDVSGVKMPFRWDTTWTGGQTVTELSEVQPNVPVDAAKFARPAPALPPKFK